jgi:hypothetical protein
MELRGWGYSLAGVIIGVAGAALGAQSGVNSVDAHMKAAEAAHGVRRIEDQAAGGARSEGRRT